MNGIPAYIESRIRRCVPSDSFIVVGSTPVVSFGNSRIATVATLGLNPSRIEFLDKHGMELAGESRRLATLSSLELASLSTAPPDAIAQVLDDCDRYFQRQPYWQWFGQLEPILDACGASYRNGTACHLDLVQWATDPTWGKLKPSSLRKRLLADDAPFLREQLRREKLRLLLVNGRGAIRQLQRTLAPNLQEVEKIVGLVRQNSHLFVGTIERLRVVAWSTNLQSSHGVTSELRTELARRVGLLSK